MNAIPIKTLCAYILVFSFSFGRCYSQGATLDSVLSSYAENLSSQIKASKRTKVSVLDFADLKGNVSDLGRFLADELSVSLVTGKGGFTVLDRANLKTILAEHKLTIEGLIDPANARKLGQFSGVDAIIIGSVTPLPDDIAITSRIIATDTAEIWGAAKARILRTPELEVLINGSPNLSRATAKQLDSNPETAPTTKTDKATKTLPSMDFGNILTVQLESIRVLPPATGIQEILVTLNFINRSPTVTHLCAIKEEAGSLVGSLLDSQNIKFTSRSGDNTLIGMKTDLDDMNNWTTISPSSKQTVSMTYYYQALRPPVPRGPFRLQLEILATTDQMKKQRRMAILNLILNNLSEE